MNTEDLGEELYNLLAQVLNSPENRRFFDSIRGEYGVLWYLLTTNRTSTVGELREKLQVVPGRMTDILTALEKKKLIIRSRSIQDHRVVNVELTEAGRKEAKERRSKIHEEYSELFDLFEYAEAKELIRLLKILLTYKKK
ncbi:MAG: transcriptional regulator [Clostridium sp.]|nr:transcriptional regulator [Clostridium sp.]